MLKKKAADKSRKICYSLSLLLLTYAVQASEYGKCLLKANINGCTRYFSVAWNMYLDDTDTRKFYVMFEPASDLNVQYFGDKLLNWYPDLKFTPDSTLDLDYKMLKLSKSEHELKEEENIYKIQVLDYAQSVNYRSKNVSWWSITRNDHQGKAWTIDFNYKIKGTYNTILAATNAPNTNLQCKIMYYPDMYKQNYDYYYRNRIAQGQVSYDPTQNFVIGDPSEFNKLVLEYKATKPATDSCNVS
ncbi:MAG: hypothetical protein K0R14_1718 [Burkholderiales bacterium]|jgi:hypothetical protein|nr:hypothetical protein [Burkholderiales bacterium]